MDGDERSGTSWWNPTAACATELTKKHGYGSHSRYLFGPIKRGSFGHFQAVILFQTMAPLKKKTTCPAGLNLLWTSDAFDNFGSGVSRFMVFSSKAFDLAVGDI